MTTAEKVKIIKHQLRNHKKAMRAKAKAIKMARKEWDRNNNIMGRKRVSYKTYNNARLSVMKHKDMVMRFSHEYLEMKAELRVIKGRLKVARK